MKRIACLALSALLAACGGDSSDADAGPIDAAPPGGTFTLAWSVVDPDDAALSCDAVAGSTVVVTGVPLDAVIGFSESFTCATGMGTSGMFDPGRYSLTVDLRTADGDSLLAAPVSLPTIELARNQEVDAGSPVFTVDPTGNMTFTIDSERDGANCGPIEEDGAAIDTVTIEVADGDGCVDNLSIDVGTGGGASGTYVTDCTTPLVFGCIENDQLLTIADRRSGPYSFTINGQRDGVAEDCFTAMTSVKLPGNDLTLEHNPVRLNSTGVDECAL